MRIKRWLKSARRNNESTFPKKWEIDEKFKILTLEEVKFLFSLADANLKSILDSAQNIVSRATTLLTITLGLAVTFAGYLFGKWSNTAKIEPSSIDWTVLIGTIYLVFVAYVVAQNLKGTRYYHSGHDPREMFQDYFIDPYFDDQLTGENKRQREYYFLQLETYQMKIDENAKTLSSRWRIQEIALNCLIAFPVVLIVSFMVSSYVLT